MSVDFISFLKTMRLHEINQRGRPNRACGRRGFRSDSASSLAATPSRICVSENIAKQEDGHAFDAPCCDERTAGNGSGSPSRIKAGQPKIRTRSNQTKGSPKKARIDIGCVAKSPSNLPESKTVCGVRSGVRCQSSETKAPQMLFSGVRSNLAWARTNCTGSIVPQVAQAFIEAAMTVLK